MIANNLENLLFENGVIITVLDKFHGMQKPWWLSNYKFTIFHTIFTQKRHIWQTTRCESNEYWRVVSSNSQFVCVSTNRHSILNKKS